MGFKQRIEAFLKEQTLRFGGVNAELVNSVEVVYHNGRYFYFHTHLCQYFDVVNEKGELLPIY